MDYKAKYVSAATKLLAAGLETNSTVSGFALARIAGVTPGTANNWRHAGKLPDAYSRIGFHDAVKILINVGRH